MPGTKAGGACPGENPGAGCEACAPGTPLMGVLGKPFVRGHGLRLAGIYTP